MPEISFTGSQHRHLQSIRLVDGGMKSQTTGEARDCCRHYYQVGTREPTDAPSARQKQKQRTGAAGMTRMHRKRTSTAAIVWISLQLLVSVVTRTTTTHGFSIAPPVLKMNSSNRRHTSATGSTRPTTISTTTALFIIPPPGSGYAQTDDHLYQSELPDTYEPMMAYPGTMRPGMTPENMPYQDLPIGDDDPDPVPWPHFQQIEWHHRWSEPPHEHPGTMESFIEAQGRWATPEQEAAMRAGARRGLREQEAQAAAGKRQVVITDDEEYDDENDDEDGEDVYGQKSEPVALGDGIFGKLGSDADRAVTAAAVSPDAEARVPSMDKKEDIMVDDGLDDFLLDLGLDAELGDENIETDVDDDDFEEVEPVVGSGGVTATINVDDDEDELASLGLDDDDDLDNDVSTVPLEDFNDSESLDTEDIFDEGGFDFDDGDFGGDDVW